MPAVAVDADPRIHSAFPSLHPQPVWTSRGTTEAPSTTVDSGCGFLVGTVDERESPVCSADNDSLPGEKPGDKHWPTVIIVKNAIRTNMETLATTVF
jgi:hypothetical protein